MFLADGVQTPTDPDWFPQMTDLPYFLMIFVITSPVLVEQSTRPATLIVVGGNQNMEPNNLYLIK